MLIDCCAWCNIDVHGMQFLIKKDVILHLLIIKLEKMIIEGYDTQPVPVSGTEWFGLLTSLEQESLLANSSHVTYKPGETIVKQGFAASHILFLEHGVVKLNVENRGKVTTFKIVNEGNFIGIMCSFVNKKLDFSAVAVTPCRVFLMGRDVLEKLINENGRFAVYVVKLMSELTNGVVHNLINMSHKNVYGAIATILLDIHEIYGSLSFTLPFSRAEMADALGYSKESVINTLSELNRDGILEISGKKVVVKDIGKLVSISHNG
ncbi:MAG: Crp/Fnr family transcriptional regulator [Bacteroidia bacterium]|nr:Crp/Fnr family transcriptional regulator [Bacteroidia bacterium]